MKRILQDEYLMLREGAEVLSRDNYGDKVLHLWDDTILKLFRVKKVISSARLFPYSLRFLQNAEKLSRLNIPTVKVIDAYKIPSIKRTAIRYRRLEGTPLGSHLITNKINEKVANKLGRFVSTLHSRGVYFRSIHLENILVLNDKGFGLIDISDMKIFHRSLSLRMRIRNFRHLTRHETHRDLLKPELMPFLDGYLERSNISVSQLNALNKHFLNHFC